MKKSCVVLIQFALLAGGVFGDNEEKTVAKGHHFVLNTGVSKQQDDTVRWYFNNILIAQINGHPSTSCVYDGEYGIFRDRLKLDHETGSLNITDITTQHAGVYVAKTSSKTKVLKQNVPCPKKEIIMNRENSYKIVKLLRLIVSDPSPSPAAPDQGLSQDAVFGICAGFIVLMVAAGVVVVICRWRSSRNDEKKKGKKLLQNA